MDVRALPEPRYHRVSPRRPTTTGVVPVTVDTGNRHGSNVAYSPRQAETLDQAIQEACNGPQPHPHGWVLSKQNK